MFRATSPVLENFCWAQLCPPVAMLAQPTAHAGSFAQAAAPPSGGLHQETSARASFNGRNLTDLTRDCFSSSQAYKPLRCDPRTRTEVSVKRMTFRKGSVFYFVIQRIHLSFVFFNCNPILLWEINESKHEKGDTTSHTWFTKKTKSVKNVTFQGSHGKEHLQCQHRKAEPGNWSQCEASLVYTMSTRPASATCKTLNQSINK